MRRSPLSHPLAVLRTTIGLTQKELGDLVNRAARTIQSIELCKLPLTEELALRIAEATGVDEGWLFAGNPDTPPRKGMTLLQAGRGHGVYTKDDYEYHRAYLETPIATKEQAACGYAARLKRKVRDELDLPILGVQKSAVRKKQMADHRSHRSRPDRINSRSSWPRPRLTDDMRVVRWKIRRFLEDLAREFSLEIGATGISVKSLELANPKPPANAKAAKPVRRQGRKTKT